MRQQINLYEVPVEPNLWKDLQPFPQLLVGVVLLLAAVYAVFAWQNAELQRKFAGIEARHQSGQQQIDTLKAQMPGTDVNPALKEEVAQLQRQLKLKQQVLDAVSIESIGNNHGFSLYMEGLARHTIKGLWLNQIELSDGGQRMGLAGKAGKPEFVPQLIQSLAAEPVFNGTEFDIFSLKNDAATGYMDFSVRARQDADPAQDGSAGN